MLQTRAWLACGVRARCVTDSCSGVFVDAGARGIFMDLKGVGFIPVVSKPECKSEFPESLSRADLEWEHIATSVLDHTWRSAPNDLSKSTH